MKQNINTNKLVAHITSTCKSIVDIRLTVKVIKNLQNYEIIILL